MRRDSSATTDSQLHWEIRPTLMYLDRAAIVEDIAIRVAEPVPGISGTIQHNREYLCQKGEQLGKQEWCGDHRRPSIV